MGKEPLCATAGSSAFADHLRGARDGEPSAVDAWYRSEHGAVYRLCFGFLADISEAEDLAQDAMLHLLDHLKDWNETRPYGPWRDAVVLNLARDRQRRLSARQRAHQAAGEREVQEREERSVDPHGELERAEMGELLVETLARLTPREREVFVLRDLEERSTEETARCLKIESGTVRSMLTLARRRVRTLLERRLGGLVTEGRPFPRGAEGELGGGHV